jgi:hypothetical protein
MTGSRPDDLIYWHFGYTLSLNYNQYNAVAHLHTFQFTVAGTRGVSVTISRLLATDLNTENSTSDHYEVCLPFLVQSPWNLGTEVNCQSQI